MFINLQPTNRNEAMHAIETLNADCRGILGRAQRTSNRESWRALIAKFEEVNECRLRIARRWGLVGFATSLNTSDPDLIDRVVRSEG